MSDLGASPASPKLVFLIHGIDSRGQGFARIISRFRRRDPQVERIKNSIADHNVIFVPLRYDPFGRFRAALYSWIGFKPKALRRIEEDLRAQLREVGVSRASVIAHSFGTYVITKIMEENEDIKFHHIIFCGSVVDDNYDWCAMQGRYSSFTNDCALEDCVPIRTRWLPGMGRSGRTGFKSGCVVNRYHRNIEHSDFFSEKFESDFWSEVIVNNILIMPPEGSGYPGA